MNQKQFKEIMKISGMNNKQLAERFDVHHQTITNYRTGKTSIPRLVEIAMFKILEEKENEQSK